MKDHLAQLNFVRSIGQNYLIKSLYFLNLIKKMKIKFKNKYLFILPVFLFLFFPIVCYGMECTCLEENEETGEPTYSTQFCPDDACKQGQCQYYECVQRGQQIGDVIDSAPQEASPTDTNQEKPLTPVIKLKIGQTEIKFDGVGCDGEKCEVDWIAKYISVIYQYGVGITAILAVVMVMAGGFLWLISGGSPDKVGKAKEFIFSAITGLTLALFSFIILSAINPSLVAFQPIKFGQTVLSPSGDTPSTYNVPPGTMSGTTEGADPTAWALAQTYVNNYGIRMTSPVRYDGTRHDPREPGYSGNVYDFHYEPNDRLEQQLTANDPSPEVLTWGTAYGQPDGSVWVREPGGSTGYHWHAEFPAEGWTWRPGR